jgi:uncharacterized protein (UPF0179 family)
MKENNKEIVYLLDKSVSKPGYRFIYHSTDVCAKCKIKDLCIGKLIEDRMYEVTEVLKSRKKIICPITNGEMILVKVRIADIKATISSKKALDNIVTTWNSPLCERYTCKFRELCFPKGLFKGDKIRVKAVDNRVACPLKYELTFVYVKPLL